MTFDCLGQSKCENGGQYLQDAHQIVQKNPCVFVRDVFMEGDVNLTNRFHFSFNAILGYQIFPKIRLNNQPFLIRNDFGIICNIFNI
jgi:hypothetical protein